MPQKIDVHGLFIDPETIEDLALQKRNAVYYPVFHEVKVQYEIPEPKSLFDRIFAPQATSSAFSSDHLLRFDHQEPYGIILQDEEQPNAADYVMDYRTAIIEKLLQTFGQAGKNVFGHITEAMQIDVSGDRQYRILQSGRNVKQISIREIPAKVQLLSGQWIDVFKSTPGYDFQGGTPYPVVDVDAAALMIKTKGKTHVLFGAGVDALDNELRSAYHALMDAYNKIQERRDSEAEKEKSRPFFQMPQINIQLPKVELPKIEMPQIRFQSPFVIEKTESKAEAEPSEKVETEHEEQESENL
jgi:hypothetical protein